MRVLAVGMGAAIGLLACAPDWSNRLPQSKERGELGLEPPEVGSTASRAVRLWSSVNERPRLFALALSDSQLQSVRRGEPSQTLLEHEVALFETSGDMQQESNGRGTWRPRGLLAADTSYTAVASNAHLKFKTASAEPVLLRVWPTVAAQGRAVYCAESNAATGARLEPLGAHPSRLWGEDRVWFGPSDAGVASNDAGDIELASAWRPLSAEIPCFLWQGAVPPTHWNGFALEPGAESEAATATKNDVLEPNRAGNDKVCVSDERDVEVACVAVHDDRIIVRPTIPDSLWLVTGDAQGWFVSEQGESGVIRGLSAEAEFTLELEVFPAAGPSLERELVVNTAPPQPHVVINEVFADPLGSEPGGEWIELYNDGAGFVTLEGWALEDDSGGVELPAVQLAPFGYALLVNDTYTRSSELDVVPDEDVFLIRLPSLGKSGLSNQGETLRLVDNSAKVVSSFPANPKPRAGVSVARREPWFVGAQARAFGLHAPPFSSPGKRNLVGFEQE